MALFTRRYPRMLSAASLIGVGVLAGCTVGAPDACSRAVSVPSFTIRFAQGLDNFSEDQYVELRNQSFAARDTVAGVLAAHPSNPSAAAVLTKLDAFIEAMDKSVWDVSEALSSSEANVAADSLGSATTLAEANQVDALVIEQCGLPSTLAPNSEPPETLPMPWIAPPDQTDMDRPLLEDESETYALGELVGTLFMLTLDSDQVMCLGRELVGVVDRSDATSNSAQYQQQFQVAFDACGIDFTVPVE